MTTALSIILITAPLAFIVGWMVSKAVFQRLAVIQKNGTRMPAQKTQSDSTDADQVPADKLRNNLLNAAVEQLRTDLLAAQSETSSAKEEAQLLREAVAEGEHRLTELKQQLQLTQAPPEASAETTSGLQNVKQIREMRALQTRVDTATQEIAELRHTLISAENRLDSSRQRFNKWRKRFSPLAKQFRQQRLIISELREELRQRDKRREQEARRATQTLTAPVVATPPPVAPRQEPFRTPEDFDKAADNLEELRGIGPALRRKLNERGIFRFQQLAELSQAELLQLGNTLGISKKMLQKHDWKTQARQRVGLSAEVAADTTGAFPA